MMYVTVMMIQFTMIALLLITYPVTLYAMKLTTATDRAVSSTCTNRIAKQFKHHIVLNILVKALSFSSIVSTYALTVQPAYAISSTNTRSVLDPADYTRLKKGSKELQYLINNWETKTQYCNFGELQRDLLSSDNKKELMQAAAKGSILDYDKSDTMNIKCKQDPQVIRALIGLLPEENTNLYQIDKLFRLKATMNSINADNIEDYIDYVEKFTIALANVDSLTYQARTDYGSTEVMSKDDKSLVTNNKSDYLSKSKQSVIDTSTALNKIIEFIEAASTESD